MTHIKVILEDVVAKLQVLKKSRKIYFQSEKLDQRMMLHREAIQNELFGEPSRHSLNLKNKY